MCRKTAGDKEIAMTTWTISTTDGRTVTSSNTAELRQAVCGWFPAMPGVQIATAMKLMLDAIRKGHVHDAGTWADVLELNLAWAPGSHRPAEPAVSAELAGYLVPVDPAEATNCEACQ
jgi:hypothetical protein